MNADALRGRYPYLPDLQHQAGWLVLVERLMQSIQLAGFEPKHHRVIQVKEKLGTLRFYVDLKNMPTAQRARVEALIAAAIAESSTLCEVCGECGQTRVQASHLKTLCAAHARQHLQFEGNATHSQDTFMKIYLDDERPAPAGWTLMRWPHEVIAALQTECVSAISLDHDLGNDQIGTGYDVLLWLEEAVANHRFDVPEIHIHTANAAARPKMLAAVAQIKLLAHGHSLHQPHHPSIGRDDQPYPEALASLRPGSPHPARWPSWYDAQGNSQACVRWIESIYTAGAQHVAINESGGGNGDGNGFSPMLVIHWPEKPLIRQRIRDAVADIVQWNGPADCQRHQMTLALSLMPWHAHEARAWLNAGARTLGHSNGALPKAQAQALIDGLYARGAMQVMLGNIHKQEADGEAQAPQEVAWALRITLPQDNPAAKRRLQAICWLLTRLLEPPEATNHPDAERATHQAALKLSTELAHELHCTRNEKYALVNMSIVFFERWGDLLQPSFFNHH
ncbi:cyclic-phosphate processing receiver domain-containing protein [Limnohabitans sp.]|jgi:hypothetical protein|uniref:cyclic-phosphate processing receiver domain-containing protein n=1 Tax=Limnohabitans sp. TaxID=1907725 RepID=UPI0037C0DDA2